MKKYFVSSEDLKGEIEGFPIEIVKRMIECQIEQGKPANVTVFQNHSCPTLLYGGFNWEGTIEGFEFWHSIMIEKDFDTFFKKYPKKEQMTMKTFTKKDLIPGKHIVEFNNGKFAIVGIDMNNRKFLQSKNDNLPLFSYDYNMKHISQPDLSIKAIYELTMPLNIFELTESEIEELLKPVWKRKIVKMIDILKAFGIEDDEITIDLGDGTTFEFKV